MNNLLVIILAAGQGTRMKSDLPKVCHKVAGRPMLGHVIQTALSLNPDKVVTVISPNASDVQAVAESFGKKVTVAHQIDQLGTGHAVLAAHDDIAAHKGDILVLYGDTPLISAETISNMQVLKAANPEAAIILLGMRPDDPARYGRLIFNENDEVSEIIEYADATEEQRAIDWCNSGVKLIDGEVALAFLQAIEPNNKQKEYYLTDVVAIANRHNRKVLCVEASPEEVEGVNTRIDLARAEYVYQSRLREAAMLEGVTLHDPETVYFSYDTQIAGRDITIGPNVVIGTGVTLFDNVTIHAYSHIEGATIKSYASIGPFARIRPTTTIGEKAKIGNFVEVKNSEMQSGAKANHHSYVGDADVGKSVNIGAGVITVNYNGYTKSRTKIGDNAFIGSNCSLIAPVEIGEKALIGAGSVITRNVLPDALSYARPPQQEIIGGAARFRRKRQDLKVINKESS
jgi:bifunctional UDP-N-acetylglucosamine pyrophosphorylase/glucosamine-1-phosphate N-acetyltransferase